MSCTKGLLAGVRVLDLTRILAGPFATMLLGDLGADVIKIENPEGGDDTRSWGPPFVESESVYFLSVNRNKRSLALNMKKPAGLEAAKKLVSMSDILIENYVPGKLDSFGMGYEDLKKVNKGLIYCSITGFGPDGPLATRQGYDVIAASMGGLLHITGPENGEPCKVGVAVTDITTGILAQGAVLAALRQKDKTGVGQKIDCNLLSSQVAVLTHVAANYLNANMDASRRGTAHPTIVPYQSFCTKDGRYLTVGAGNNRQFMELCQRVGLSHLFDDPKFKDNKDRVENRAELIGILREKFHEKTSDEWLDVLEGSNLPYGPINNMKEVFAEPQVSHNNMIMDIPHPKLGKNIRLPGSPVMYSDKEAYIPPSAPPLLGQHSREVLKNVIGYSDNLIDELVASGVVHESS